MINKKKKAARSQPDYKIGLGYDIHRLVEGRKLVLGGVAIPCQRGLDGHSDADVLLHAVCDALLGALGQGDIGEHFPNTDEQYRNISSLKLLRTVHRLAKDQNYAIGNIDAVIIAQEPKLQSYKKRMQELIAAELHVLPGAVNIKATTNEGLGALGHQEGIAAYATVLLKPG